jgi:ankyrin repeat protein
MLLCQVSSLVQNLVGGNARDSATVRLLLACGIDPNASDSNGVTPLMHKMDAGELTVIESLLCNGADPNISQDEPLIMRALQKSSAQTVQLLIRYGADANARSLSCATAIHVATSAKAHISMRWLVGSADLDALVANGDTSLHIAASGSDLVSLQVLGQGGTNLDIRNSKEETALDIAVAVENDGSVEMLTHVGNSKLKKGGTSDESHEQLRARLRELWHK